MFERVGSCFSLNRSFCQGSIEHDHSVVDEKWAKNRMDDFMDVEDERTHQMCSFVLRAPTDLSWNFSIV